jgi:sulfopyruvate decarboxylase subunit beta
MAKLDGPRGRDIIAAIKEAGVTHVAALPDIVTSEGLLWPLSRDPDLKLVRLCKEDEGVSICAALALCDTRAVLMMQMTGFLDSLNAIRGVAVDFGEPVCMIVGLLGKEPDRPPSESKRFGVRIVEPILDAMGIDHFCMEGPEDVARLAPAIIRAYETSRPLAALVGRPVVP